MWNDAFAASNRFFIQHIFRLKSCAWPIFIHLAGHVYSLLFLHLTSPSLHGEPLRVYADSVVSMKKGYWYPIICEELWSRNNTYEIAFEYGTIQVKM